MGFHNPFARHVKTKFVRLNTNLCKACWNCVEACPNNVIGKIDLPIHRHAHISHAEKCKGCKKCVGACSHEAIIYTCTSPNSG